MKRILFISLISLLVCSCTTLKPPYSRFSNAIDFSEYTRKGFFITEANSVSFEYEPCGSVVSVVTGGYEVIGRDNWTSNDEVYGSDTKVKYGNLKPATVEDALDELYNSARELGADGIINFKLEYYPPDYAGTTIIKYSSYVVSGMAIKRK